jgi:hypothetical protein
MARESIAQYRDYYESDGEEQAFFEYLDNLSNRDRIRFMEIGEDYSISVQHKVSTFDCQPTVNDGIMVMITG